MKQPSGHRRGAGVRVTSFWLRPAPKGVDGSRNSAGDPLKVGINTHDHQAELRGVLTKWFAVETLYPRESGEFRTRAKMIVLVLLVDEPRPTQFAQCQPVVRGTVSSPTQIIRSKWNTTPHV